MEQNLKDGKLIILNKPYGWTSFQAVNKIKYWAKNESGIKKIKVGHAGTLDPLATGVLIVCIGAYTKKIEEFQHMEKEYIARFVLGKTTPTFDLESEVEEVGSLENIDEEGLRKCLQGFLGEQMQIPPIHSAVKVNGKRAYELARNQEEVILNPKKIYIREIELTACTFPEIELRVVCGKGTYIRSLARDIGEKLGCGAYMSALCRSRIGKYTIQEAESPDTYSANLKKVF